MPGSHRNNYPIGGRRRVLIADDEFINRNILGMILKDEYEVLYAADGEEALHTILRHNETINLVLLDLIMPGMNGMELLRKLKEDEELRKIPVIVMTSNESAEVECLRLGAMDFIPKPYPQPEVLLARVTRTIELAEDRQIIYQTERDALTGLYNIEFFYRYAQLLDRHRRDREMDAIVIDINHFRMMNERYGKTYCDRVLIRLAENLHGIVGEEGGIVCRKGGDTFMIYSPHVEDYALLLNEAALGLDEIGRESGNAEESAPDGAEDGNCGAKHAIARLRMGVYPECDRGIDIERRFDRAKLAADTVRNSFTKVIALYDKTLHDSELYAEQLVEAFPNSIDRKQFGVYFQPKFNIQGTKPVMVSAEALVRWHHPDLGMISPGVFIPIFEQNGLIGELDRYVWNETAAQIAEWKKKYGRSIPVSVNVSRIDILDAGISDVFQGIIRRYGLSPEDLLLEITESAYTEGSERIVEAVNRLRGLGFKIEMDDFGTGYSSLGMISHLPIDALKLDMIFIRSAFSEHKDVRMLELMIDIANYLEVPVIAEGVETEEQMLVLKDMGCDIVQGYYFSKPLPPWEFASFMEEWQADMLAGVRPGAPKRGRERSAVRNRKAEAESAPQEAVSVKQPAEAEEADILPLIAETVLSDYFAVYYVNPDSGHYTACAAGEQGAARSAAYSGEDFFSEIVPGLLAQVHTDDRTLAEGALRRENLLQAAADGSGAAARFRMYVKDTLRHVILKSIRAAGHTQHIVVGLCDIEKQAEREAAGEVLAREDAVYSKVARALASDYFSIYDVDITTNHFTQYRVSGAYEGLGLEKSGDDFFALSRKNVLRVVSPEDVERVRDAMNRDVILTEVRENGFFTLTYRLLFEDEPVYVSLKATLLDEDGVPHLIVGISSIEEEMKRQEEFSRIRAEHLTHARIAQALAGDYFCIYLVNTETDHFIEYSSHDMYQQLELEKSGDDFFNLARSNILRVVVPEDQEKLRDAFVKETMMEELTRNGVFTVSYRLQLGGRSVYVSLKATRMGDGSDRHIVIGASSIDAQVLREQEYEKKLGTARAMINRDALTGVKSRHAFLEAEADWNEHISAGDNPDFAIAMCDVNNLKEINETRGHREGDRFILEASSLICTIFKHSPVYRIGGDEFAVILSGHDFAHRTILKTQLEAGNREHLATGQVVVSCGISGYIPGIDETFEDVLHRAEYEMTENKRQLKSVGGGTQ